MKKLLTLAVLVGGVTAAVAYKLKKQQEEKDLLDLEIELLNKEIEEGHEECQKQNQDDSDDEGNCECETVEECCCEDTCTCEHDEETQCECEVKEETEEIVEEIMKEIKTEVDPDYPHLNHDVKAEIEEMNQEMINSLQAQGDHHEEERPIQHFVEFTSEEDLQAFKQVIVNKGYVVTRGENPSALSVLHIAPVDRSKLVTHIYYIANQAINHHGSYKGWKSRVAY